MINNQIVRMAAILLLASSALIACEDQAEQPAVTTVVAENPILLRKRLQRTTVLSLVCQRWISAGRRTAFPVVMSPAQRRCSPCRFPARIRSLPV